MTSGFTPTVARFDPDAGATADLWNRLLEGVDPPGAMLLLADPAARASGWAPRAALALADAVAQRYGSALLVDLQLDQPQLHRVAGIRNEEGIVDVLLFGASMEHVAHRVAGGTARVVPAGPVVPGVREVTDDPAWSRVIDEATATGGMLLVYAPLEEDLGALPARLRQAVLLRGAAGGDAVTPDGVELVGIVAPPVSPPSPPPSVQEATSADPDASATGAVPSAQEPAGPEKGDVGTGAPLPPGARPPATPTHAARGLDAAVVSAGTEREALVADLRSRQEAALAASGRAASGEPRPAVVIGESTASAGPTAQTAAPTDLPPERADHPPTRRSRRPMILATVLVLVLISAVAMVWHYFGRAYFGTTNVPVAVEPPPASEDDPRPAGDRLPYSVAIEAHQDLPTAAARADALDAAEAAIGFYIAPVLVDSVLNYRVMAGPVSDSATAVAILDTLLAKGHKMGSSEYDVRNTPLTFLLDEFETREQAAERMRELRRLDIPSYVVEVPYTSGPPRFRLYSGAYAGPAEADVMRQFLQNVGLADTLVLRTGLPRS
jgi:hypothetical protein